MDGARADDRGQLILIAGIGVAVALVALALILNSLVFTQYLATKPSPDGSEAVAYQHAVADGVRGLVSEANYREYDGNVSDTVRNGTGTLSDLLARQYGAHGTLVNATVRSVENGTSIHQDAPRRFTNASGNGNWTLFGGADGVRGFRMTITNASAASAEHPFRLNVTLEGGMTPIEIYPDTNGSGLIVNDTTDENSRLNNVSTPATIDFANGSVNGSHTDQLDFYESENVTDVAVANGERAVGKYVVVANRSEEDVTTSDDYYDTTDRSPYAVPAVYATTLHASYAAPDVTYETDVHVSPSAFGAGPDGEDGRYGVFRPPGDTVFRYNDAPTNLSVMNATGTDPQRFPQTDVEAIGPREYDFTGDDVLDVPYVDDAGNLYLTNASGSTTRLATDVFQPKSLLAIGYWNGTGPSVFYAGDNKVNIYRVQPGHEPTLVVDNSNNGGANGASGIGDVDGDGENELVFVGGSQEQYVYEPEGGKADKIENGQAAQNQGIGASQPIDFNGDGVARVPHVDGSNNLDLVDTRDGTNTNIISGGVANSPVTAYDVDGDGSLEIIYLNTNSHLMYVDNVTGTPIGKPLLNESGGAILGSKKTGVA
ncbi:hypothetical protein MBEHAL_1797 [Halarchaeum acidiphilum MH1-52-1]|uniref:VCBS repeat-containing protein n=1 Tax=Halarchaeum acidiphilum MH1-52-1 TaxID=1261545 RepID=U2YW67_9EURY|nr:hypothetical protein [Halarchaeum acidiphilum]GAD53037.1 hypothetical protein MBEHAL_1797 [Halarchaeum acidiphilum MH1-52-1]